MSMYLWLSVASRLVRASEHVLLGTHCCLLTIGPWHRSPRQVCLVRSRPRGKDRTGDTEHTITHCIFHGIRYTYLLLSTALIIRSTLSSLIPYSAGSFPAIHCSRLVIPRCVHSFSQVSLVAEQVPTCSLQFVYSLKLS